MAADGDFSDSKGNLDRKPAHGNTAKHKAQCGHDPGKQPRRFAREKEASPLHRQHREQGQGQRQTGPFRHGAGDYIDQHQ